METAGNETGVTPGREITVGLQDNINVKENVNVPPEVQKANELLQKLITSATKLTIELATCECPNAHRCDIVKSAKEIAKVVKEFQNMRPPETPGGVVSGQSGRKV